MMFFSINESSLDSLTIAWLKPYYSFLMKTFPTNYSSREYSSKLLLVSSQLRTRMPWWMNIAFLELNSSIGLMMCLY